MGAGQIQILILFNTLFIMSESWKIQSVDGRLGTLFGQARRPTQTCTPQFKIEPGPLRFGITRSNLVLSFNKDHSYDVLAHHRSGLCLYSWLPISARNSSQLIWCPICQVSLHAKVEFLPTSTKVDVDRGRWPARLFRQSNLE